VKKEYDAYWVRDGSSIVKLYEGGKTRAAANTDLNWAKIYTQRGLFRETDQSLLVVSLDKVIISEVEKKLGFAQLPVFDKNGDRLTDFRNEMEARTRSFDHYPPTPNPVAEAVWYLDKIQEALNVAACESGLNAPAADAWLLCAKANAALEKERQFSRKTADMIESASKALVAALMLPPLLKDSHMSAAAIKCNRAAMFARQYGPKAERGAYALERIAHSHAAHPPLSGRTLCIARKAGRSILVKT
jgi:hypothetical protein